MTSPTVVDRNTLIKLLRGLGALDNQGLSPFVAVQLGEDGVVEMYRTGMVGYARTLGAAPNQGEWCHCSAAHLVDCLRVFQAERVALHSVGGILVLHEVESMFETELRVHTVPKERAGHKSHKPGADVFVPEPGWFKDCDLSPFVMAAPSVLDQDTLRMVTQFGALFFHGPQPIDTAFHPRNSTLLHCGGRTFDELSITEGGYYRTVADGIEMVTAGYKPAGDIFLNYRGDSKKLASYPAERLVYALKAAASLAVPSGPIMIHPKEGVTARDQHGNLDRFGMTASDSHTPFTLTPKAAKTVADALGQSSDAEVVLSELPGQVYRLTRGPWDFNFKAVHANLGKS